MTNGSRLSASSGFFRFMSVKGGGASLRFRVQSLKLDTGRGLSGSGNRSLISRCFHHFPLGSALFGIIFSESARAGGGSGLSGPDGLHGPLRPLAAVDRFSPVYVALCRIRLRGVGKQWFARRAWGRAVAPTSNIGVYAPALHGSRHARGYSTCRLPSLCVG
jgi:hypothetical protein